MTTNEIILAALAASTIGLATGYIIGALFTTRPVRAGRPVAVRIKADLTEYQEAMKKARGNG